MAALDDLAPDQRAVLQLVLQRGRSYDEIAQLLSIDRGAVRQRALDAFDALTPATVLPGPEQALVTDYLLRQLPERVSEQVYAFLQASDADRAWAEAIVAVIGPLVSGSLPEIPVGAALGADDWSSGGPERDSDSADAEGGAPAAAGEQDTPAGVSVTGTGVSVTGTGVSVTGTGMSPPIEPWHDPRFHADIEEPPEPRPSSRRGGAILLVVVAVLIAVAIVIAVANSGNGGGNHPLANTDTGTGSQVTTTRTTATTGTTGTTPTQILAQLNLRSPNGATHTVGIVDVARVKGIVGVVIYATGVPPNSAHNAYAVWLYNSPTSHRFVGFVPNLVGKNGKLVTDGELPADAAKYHHLLLTLETQSKPTAPGEVVLSGTFREHP